jgi:hypothetical protein
MKRELVEQVSQATGGPLKYKGPDMKEVHRNMGITDAQFDAVAADLKKALDKNKVAESDAKIILGAFGTYRKDIVQPKKTDEKKQDGKKTEDKKPADKKTEDKKQAAQTSVAGKVTYNGKPIPAGTVGFVDAGGKTYKANLTEEGNYQLAALKPGEYKVTVETASARPAQGAKGAKAAGKYVAIPVQYADAKTSAVVCNVQDGKNVFDIALSD